MSEALDPYLDACIDEMEAKLLDWNDELMALPAGDEPDAFMHVPTHWPSPDDTKAPERVALLDRITAEIADWLKSLGGENDCVYFNGEEGVTVMIGSLDVYLIRERVLH